MAGVNNNNNKNVENVAENQVPLGPTHPQDDPNYEEYVREPLMDIPPLPVGAEMETVMDAINHQWQYMREQNL
ncbi:hypothetical protein A2U01_0078777 [Trifolium medium]|uniref:Uncharacterized protein n=1 Tax=Trifolium medium TaxID=97028 RepID=A0A392TBM0_9FABA|nr:hypothetical protein [Trifolium medium]